MLINGSIELIFINSSDSTAYSQINNKSQTRIWNWDPRKVYNKQTDLCNERLYSKEEQQSVGN